LHYLLLRTAHLLSAIDPATGKPLDDRQLRAEISTFMGAGFETTSHAITWNLTMLVSPEAFRVPRLKADRIILP
jgi:cytochrome P450